MIKPRKKIKEANEVIGRLKDIEATLAVTLSDIGVLQAGSNFAKDMQNKSSNLVVEDKSEAPLMLRLVTRELD